jgi:hypothetical protein
MRRVVGVFNMKTATKDATNSTTASTFSFLIAVVLAQVRI